jgi:NitT/TauT family transport system substrate-binding protein
MKRPYLGLAGALVGLGMLTACGTSTPSSVASTSSASSSAGSASLTPFKVQLGFIANTQNYAIPHGIADGAYAEAGLQVSFTPGGIGVDPIKVVASGKAQVGIANGESLVAAEGAGLQLKVLGAEFGISPLGMLCRDDANVSTLKDIVGKKIGVRPISSPGFPTLLKSNGIKPSSITVVNVSNTDEANLIAGHIDCEYADLALNEPRIVANAGVPNHILLDADYGQGAQENVYFTTASYYETHQKLLKSWIQATQTEWKGFLANPIAGAEWILAHESSEGLDAAQEKAQATAMVPFISTKFTEVHGLLAPNPTLWAESAQTAYAAGTTKTLVDTSAMLTSLVDPAIS